MSTIAIPETVNIHIWPKCNLKCVYCFGRFPARPSVLSSADWCHVLDLLAEARVKRVNFSGGEPTLYPDLGGVIAHARRRKMDTSIVTNGAALDAAIIEQLDMVALSVDSADEETSRRMGRFDRRHESYTSHIEEKAGLVRAAGVCLKINTVVTRLNKDDDLLPFYRRLGPSKVKLLQFTEVGGENDDTAAGLRISAAEFESFAARHVALRDDGVEVVVEGEDTIRRSYIMIDPSGRIFQHAGGKHRVSPPVLEVGFVQAMRAAGGYDRSLFEQRGGHIHVAAIKVRRGGR